MKLDNLLQVLLEAKEKFGGDILVGICDSDNQDTDIDEMFYYENYLRIGSHNGCDSSGCEFYHKFEE
jgi:hypothetical protein